MALTGCMDVSQIGRHLLALRGSDGVVRSLDDGTGQDGKAKL